jgi:H+/Cl- antiporter ClcA
MVDIKGWLLSIVIGLGFWAFVSASLSLFIQ